MDPKEEVLNTNQEQVHDILFNRQIDWQEIIYDLINTEQLNPWDVNIVLLTDKFFEKIDEYGETDFFVSSKVLLAASFLLRIKSEFLLNKYIRSIDEILFGEKENKKTELERIELEEEIPILIPKSPMPRYKRVTLQELIGALNKAIVTENRRIKKEILNKNALREMDISLPKRRFNIKDKLKELHDRLLDYFKKSEEKKITYSSLVGEDRDERIAAFFPLLQLENSKKIWLEQEQHFEEIHIWLKDVFFRENPDYFADLIRAEIEEIEEEIQEIEDSEEDDEEED